MAMVKLNKCIWITFCFSKLGSNNSFQPQKYYTNQNSDFGGNTVGNRLNDDADPAQNDAFFSPLEFKETKPDSKETVTMNRTWHAFKLNKASLTTNNKCSQLRELATNDVFRNYFRGLLK
jgi:hypothetical protein